MSLNQRRFFFSLRDYTRHKSRPSDPVSP